MAYWGFFAKFARTENGNKNNIWGKIFDAKSKDERMHHRTDFCSSDPTLCIFVFFLATKYTKLS